jgi:ubiquinone/menaquinone biosynthesis C-methylase UbiE
MHMSTPLIPAAEDLKAAQQQAWSDPASVMAWRKWFPQFVVQTREATHAIVESAQLRPGLQVLDLASGSGEPALTLASLVGPGGHVTATDLVPDMLDIAEENARRLGLSNMTFKQADAEALPFPGESFDVVTCRFGIIYCPDAGQALREIQRVLRPGGRVALVAWGPPAQPFFATTVGVFARYVQIPPAASGTPLPFQFAQPGTLSAVMIAAGFQQVREETCTIAWTFPGSVEECWDYQREITGAAFRRIFAGLAPEKHAQVIGEVLAAIRQYYDGRQVNYTANIVSASGLR